MQGRDHIAIGSFAGAAVLGGLSVLGVRLGVGEMTAGALAAGFGAILPDLDHPNSKASNSLPTKLLVEAGSFAFMMVGLWFVFRSYGAPTSQLFTQLRPIISFLTKGAVVAVILLVCSAAIRSFTGHRGVTHSFVGAGVGALLSLVICAILSLPLWYSALIGIGWLTHLAADATTHDGLPQLMWLLRGTAEHPVTTHPASPVYSPARTAPASPPVAPSAPPVAPDTAAEPTFSSPLCTRCGAPMVRRVARRGERAGQAFLGCSNFPKCRETQPVEN